MLLRQDDLCYLVHLLNRVFSLENTTTQGNTPNATLQQFDDIFLSDASLFGYSPSSTH